MNTQNKNYDLPQTGEPIKQKTPIDDIGAVTIPDTFRKKAGLELGSHVWVIDDDEIAIVIKKDFSGYEDCEMDECMIDTFGNVELPVDYLCRLDIDENQELTISLSYEENEVVIETFNWARIF